MAKRKVKVKTEMVENKFHIKVKKCCMSCAFKDQTRCVNSRFCVNHETEVKRTHVCGKWEMSLQQRMAGYPRGRVKCREYLMYVLAVREDEELAIERGEEVTIKTVNQLRKEFREHHGEIYEIV
jgi:hypothetical protein